MLNFEQILNLIDKLNDSTLSEISISQKDFNLTLKKEISQFVSTQNTIQSQVLNSVQPQIQKEETEIINKKENLIEIKSPMVGTFYASASPDSPAFVEIGKKIKIGDVLCIIEAMKVMNELPAEVEGIIEEICVNNGQIVEFGQVLFKLK